MRCDQPLEASPRNDREFEVVIEKSPEDQRIGLDISVVGGKVLKVWKVKDGLVNEWNKNQAPEMQVKGGDAVVAVNGKRGSADQLLEEVSKGRSAGDHPGVPGNVRMNDLSIQAAKANCLPVYAYLSEEALVRCVDSRGPPVFVLLVSRRTWSKQHYRIRTPRPLTDKFDLSRVQPQKEWWRERRVAPATFFGFPDVTKAGLRGGSLYTEQMDAVTLAVLADKCVQEKVWDPEIWLKFSWRAQQLSTRTQEPDLCYIFRAFARADWFDQNLLTTYLGRLHRRLPQFQLPDVAVLLEAFENSRFRQGEYLQRSLTHMALLLQHRDDAGVEDLARTCVALRNLRPQPAVIAVEVRAGLLLLAEALLLRELSELSPSQAIGVMDALVCWGLVNSERPQSSNAAADLCWSLARELKGKLRSAGRENPEDLALLAMALSSGKIDYQELWQELVTNLELEMHRLSGSAASKAVYSASKYGHRGIKLYENAGRLLGEEASTLSSLDCAYAAGGFLRGPGSLAEQAILSPSACCTLLHAADWDHASPSGSAQRAGGCSHPGAGICQLRGGGW
ncbi:unnamed protein product [Symbiodinium pilosum]|uniref:PDZ domain-containing protein n=1 Tax=Symbiodinium pilosum TaxID=2952 RepID=A0A812L6D5_SYMPI|nr:unnamed protein product [Symbiodinium pilosum]